MQRSFAAYLCDIHNAANDILSHTSRFDEQMFSSSVLVQDAVERKFEIMGEAMTQCRIHHPAEVLALGDIQGVIDFRNFLAHRYHRVSHVLIWDILQNDLPTLLERVTNLLGGVDCRHV